MTAYDIVVPVEAMTAHSDSTNFYTVLGVFAEAFGIDDGLLGNLALNFVLQDDFTGDETAPTVIADFLNSLQDDFTGDDGTPAVNSLVALVVSEDVHLDDVVLGNANFNLLLQDGAMLALSLDINGQQFTAWVANSETFAHSRYENFDYNSMCRLGTHYFGCKDDGVYILEGSNDAGTEIDWYASFGTTDFGTSRLKILPRVYIGFTGDNAMVLRTIVDGGAERLYMFKKRTGYLAGSTVKIGAGVKSRYWGFDLMGVAGSDVDLDKIEFYPIVLGKRLNS